MNPTAWHDSFRARLSSLLLSLLELDLRRAWRELRRLAPRLRSYFVLGLGSMLGFGCIVLCVFLPHFLVLEVKP